MKRIFNALIDLKGPEDGELEEGSLEEYIYLIKVMGIFMAPFAIILLIVLY